MTDDELDELLALSQKQQGRTWRFFKSKSITGVFYLHDKKLWRKDSPLEHIFVATRLETMKEFHPPELQSSLKYLIACCTHIPAIIDEIKQRNPRRAESKTFARLLSLAAKATPRPWYAHTYRDAGSSVTAITIPPPPAPKQPRDRHDPFYLAHNPQEVVAIAYSHSMHLQPSIPDNMPDESAHYMVMSLNRLPDFIRELKKLRRKKNNAISAPK